MTPAQQETIANAAAMLDGFALELRRAHALPPDYKIIPEPDVAAEEKRIKRVVVELYDIAGMTDGAPSTCAKCNTPDLCREYGRACDPYPGDTEVPAIVFYPAGSLGEPIESEDSEA